MIDGRPEMWIACSNQPGYWSDQGVSVSTISKNEYWMIQALTLSFQQLPKTNIYLYRHVDFIT